MRFVLLSHDKPNSLQLRLANRAAHLHYIEQTGMVETAGPLIDDAGQMCGSLIILNTENMAKAQEWAKNDPYAKAGLFQSTTLAIWNKVIG